MFDSFFKKSGSPKTFWQRPEGVTGFIFAGAIAYGIGYLLYKFLPYIITLLQNTLYAVFLFAALAGVLYVLLDPKFRNLVWFMYKSGMRALTGLFVQIDPIGILQTYVEDLYKNLGEMNDNIAKLKGQMQKLKTIIETNQKEMEHALNMADQAKKSGNMDVVVINTRQYGRLEDTNKKFLELYAKMEILYRVLSKMHKNSEFLIKDIENEVRIKKQEREAIRTSYSAMRRAMSIINGDPDKKMMFDQAMEAIVDDVSAKIGEMERFMELSASFIDSVDIQNGMYEQKGLEILERMEKEGISSILNPDRQLNAHQADSFNDEIKSEKPLGEKNKNDYSNLF